MIRTPRKLKKKIKKLISGKCVITQQLNPYSDCEDSFFYRKKYQWFANFK